MLMNGRLDGHIVQGHVDTTAVCESVETEDGSWRYRFRYEVSPEMIRKGYMTVEKGSVTVNGVSLTVCDSEKDSFSWQSFLTHTTTPTSPESKRGPRSILSLT